MQRHAALAIPLGPRDLYSVQAPCAHDLDALRTEAHGVRDCALHRAAKHDPLLQLLRDRIRDELCVELGLAHFLDIDVHRHAQHLLQLELQRFDVLAFLTDHDAWTGAVNGDARVLGRALDHHPGHRGMGEPGLQMIAHLDVFEQHGRKVFGVRVPPGAPVAIERKPETDRIYFLSHLLLSPVADRNHDMAGRLVDARAAALGLRAEAPQKSAALDADGGDRKFVYVGTVVVFGIGNSRFQHLADDYRSLLRGELQNV